MTKPCQTEEEQGERVLTVIPDANVLVHGKALPDLPWAELGRTKIEILLVSPVIRELDKLKNQSGRPNKIARELSSDVRKLHSAPDRRAEVRRSSPTVTKRVELRTITTPLYDALKLEHADQALINYALHLRNDGLDVQLLTDDTICGTTAIEFGLSTMFLPTHWLRDLEPDGRAKEITNLKAEIKRLLAAEPKIMLSFCDNDRKNLTRLEFSRTRWPQLTTGQIEGLIAEVQQRCPVASSFERQVDSATDKLSGPMLALNEAMNLGRFQSHSIYMPATHDEIERYNEIDYPNWLESIRAALGSLSQELEKRTQWPTVLAVASNIGTRPANEARLRLSAQGAFVIANAEKEEQNAEVGADQDSEILGPLALPLPPTPPRGSMRLVDPLLALISQNMFSLPQGASPFDLSRLAPPLQKRSDAFYWRTPRAGWNDLMELECTRWRHSQDEVVFPIKVQPLHSTNFTGAIELSVHASNLSDPAITRLPVQISFDEGSTIQEARILIAQLGRSASIHGRL